LKELLEIGLHDRFGKISGMGRVFKKSKKILFLKITWWLMILKTGFIR
jgi:hypothetical protein